MNILEATIAGDLSRVIELSNDPNVVASSDYNKAIIQAIATGHCLILEVILKHSNSEFRSTFLKCGVGILYAVHHIQLNILDLILKETSEIDNTILIILITIIDNIQNSILNGGNVTFRLRLLQRILADSKIRHALRINDYCPLLLRELLNSDF